MSNTKIIDDIINLYKNSYNINKSQKYIESFFVKILDNIQNSIKVKLLSSGFDIKTDINIFTNKYNSFVYNFMNNINSDSEMNKELTGHNNIYLINNFKKYILFSLLTQKMKNISIIKDIHSELFQNFKLNKILKANTFYLNPHFNIKYVEKLNLQSKQKAELTINRLYTCKKCKKNKTKCNKIQTRSCDEGCTMFINCIECGYKWTMNA